MCVNITGTPPPFTTMQTQEDVSMEAKYQTQFCSTFDKSSDTNILTVFITASNCFGSTTANASISFINGKYEQYFEQNYKYICCLFHVDISRCNFTTCLSLESSTLDPQQLASTASSISCK